MPKDRIKVLIVDDSSVFRLFLTWIINSDAELEVVGAAHDGYEALAMAPKLKPDLITIDINMPRLSGFETTEQIMQVHPVPIIIVSGLYNSSEATFSFNALKSGAVAILPKPEGVGHPKHDSTVKHFLTMIKTMAEVKVIRRVNHNVKQFVESNIPTFKLHETKIIAIGASAGGPPVLQEILLKLKPDFSIPIIIVQHVDPSFAESLCTWLAETTKRNVLIARDNDQILPGNIYMAPPDSHISVNDKGRIEISKSEPIYSCRPSVSYLYKGVTKYFERYALGIILTGMGRDGALELKEMLLAGAQTIVQDPATVLVNGMTGEALRLNAATQVLTPSQIATYLNQLNK